MDWILKGCGYGRRGTSAVEPRPWLLLNQNSVHALHLGGWESRQNRVYDSLSPSLKIVLAILTEGLRVDDKGELHYDDCKGRSWLSKLARDLEGQVSRDTIDRNLDLLLDQRMLRHGQTIMELVSDPEGDRWVRAYYVSTEYIPRLLWLYRATHDLTKAQSQASRQVD